MTRYHPIALIAVPGVEEIIVQYERDIEQRYVFSNYIPIGDGKTASFSIFIFPISYNFTHVGF